MADGVLVDSNLFHDPRFQVLLGEFGLDRSLSLCLRAWFVGFRFWSKGRRLIPPGFLPQEFIPMIACGLIEDRGESGYYCRGSRERFEWKAKFNEGASRGGKNSARARAEKYGSSQPRSASEEALGEKKSTEATSGFSRSGSEAVRSGSEDYGDRNPRSASVISSKPLRTGSEPARTLSNPSSSSSSSKSSKELSKPPENLGGEFSSNSQKPKAEKKLRVEITPADHKLGEEWHAFALATMPWATPDKSWTPVRFAQALAECRQKVGLSEQRMAEVLAFVRGSDFWRDKALSPVALLNRNSSGQRKIENILVGMSSLKTTTKPVNQLPAMPATIRRQDLGY